jgi:hypothetical protein
MELGLFQRDLRARFKLEKETYANWEKDRCYPAMKPWPGIIEFLGYDPSPVPKTMGERLLAYRRRNGLSREVGLRKPGCPQHLATLRFLKAG